MDIYKTGTLARVSWTQYMTSVLVLLALSRITEGNEDLNSHGFTERKTEDVQLHPGGCEERANHTFICTGENITQIPPNLEEATRILHFTRTSIANIPDGAFEMYQSLENLAFTLNPIKGLSAGAFRGLNNLTFMSIIHSTTHTIDIDNGTFEGLGALKTLLLQRINLNRFPINVVQNLRNLEGLYVSSNKIESLQDMLPESLGNLNDLSLLFNEIHSIKPGAFRHLSNLTRLNLASNKLKTFSADVLVGLNNLKTLDLSRNNINRVDGSICAFSASLEKLDLGGNGYLRQFTSQKDCTGLTTLDLSYNRMSCDCGLLWLLEGRTAGKPWSTAWGPHVRCGAPSWAPFNKALVTDLSVEDLACDLPFITPITSTNSSQPGANERVIFEVEMQNGYPYATWIMPDGSELRKRSGAPLSNYGPHLPNYKLTAVINQTSHTSVSRMVLHWSDWPVGTTTTFRMSALNLKGRTEVNFTISKPPDENSGVERINAVLLGTLIPQLLMYL